MSDMRKANGIYSKYVKRFFSVLFCIILTPFVLFVSVFVALFIKITDGGTVLYKSERLGKEGKVFTMYKFRSMNMNAPVLHDKDGLSTYKGDDDPRVTKIGKFIRKYGVDELPQLINIYKGDMAFIGPRPDLPDAADIFSKRIDSTIKDIIPDRFYEDYYSIRMAVRPGITCYGPVFLAEDTNRVERSINDAWYAKNISFKLDCLIIFGTIKHLVSGRHK